MFSIVATNWLPTSSQGVGVPCAGPSSTNELKFRAEDVAKRRPARPANRATTRPPPVRRKYAALIVDGSRPALKRVQIFAAIVEGDQDVAAMVFAEQPVLDLGCGHGDECLGVSLPGHAIRRSIQLFPSIDRRAQRSGCGAGEIVVARKKMLAPMHDDRSLEMAAVPRPLVPQMLSVQTVPGRMLAAFEASLRSSGRISCRAAGHRRSQRQS